MCVDRDVSACVSVCADRGCEREKSPSCGWTWHRKEPRIHVTDGPRGEEGTCCVSSCFRPHVSPTQGTHTRSDGLLLPHVCNAMLLGRKDAHTPGERGDEGKREKEEGKGEKVQGPDSGTVPVWMLGRKAWVQDLWWVQVCSRTERGSKRSPASFSIVFHVTNFPQPGGKSRDRGWEVIIWF